MTKLNTLLPATPATGALASAITSGQSAVASMKAQLTGQPSGGTLTVGLGYTLIVPSILPVRGVDDSGNTLGIGTLVLGGRTGATVMYVPSPVYTITDTGGNTYSVIPTSSIIGSFQ